MKLVKIVTGAVVIAAAGALGGLGCGKGDPATEYVAGFSTQVQVPKEFKTLEYSVRAYSATDPIGVVTDCARVEVVDGRARLPKTLGVHKKNTEAPNVMVTVVAYTKDIKTVDEDRGKDCESSLPLGEVPEGSKNPLGVRLLRRSKQSYRDGRILYLPMPLKFACFDQKCGDDQTCVGGRCVTFERSKFMFQDYSPALAFGDSSSCFSLARCLSDAVSPTLEDATTCTYSVPGTLEGMNVRAIFEGMVTEVLDVDSTTASVPGFDSLSAEEQDQVRKSLDASQEGYTITAPGKFRLAPGLCELTKTNDPKRKKILALAASRSCPPKPPEQPLCDENGEVLIPAPSKLLVLLDRSEKMKEVLYPAESTPDKDPVKLILELSLDDPVFSTTQVAFKWLPDKTTTATCAPNAAYADANGLDVKFVPALSARDQIAKLVSDDRGVVAARAPEASVENALNASGVYALLSNLQDKNKLNLRAVVVLTNNPVGNSCGGALLPAPTAMEQAAETAFNTEGIITYVIQLGQKGTGSDGLNQNDPNSVDRNARVDQCKALVTGGAAGDNCFDASSKDNAGLAPVQALGKIVSDLSSCLYEKPGSITDGGRTTLTILGQPDVKFNGDCRAGSNADGWNFAGEGQSLIRICGTSCETLRSNSRNVGSAKLGRDFISIVDPAQAPPATSTPPVLFVTAVQRKSP